MDGNRFDQLTRSLAANTSRRRMLGGLTALLAGAAPLLRSERSEAAKGGGGPNPCNVYCASEPGSRGAQCRQVCKECGGPDAAGFCYNEKFRQFVCCPSGLTCFRQMNRDILCCADERQICFDNNFDHFCCPDGTFCTLEPGICCPTGGSCNGECCSSPGEQCCRVDFDYDNQICGLTCFDRSVGDFRCGEPDEIGDCAPPCPGQIECGDGCCDEDAGCCYDPSSDALTCGSSCYNPCQGWSQCGTPDVDGFCLETTCIDPLCGTVCGDANPDRSCIFPVC